MLCLLITPYAYDVSPEEHEENRRRVRLTTLTSVGRCLSEPNSFRKAIGGPTTTLEDPGTPTTSRARTTTSRGPACLRRAASAGPQRSRQPEQPAYAMGLTS